MSTITLSSQSGAPPILLRPPVGLALRMSIYSLFLVGLGLIVLTASLYWQKPYVGSQIVLRQGSWVVGVPPWGSLAQVEGIRRGSQAILVNGKPVGESAAGQALIPSRKVHSLTVRESSGRERTISDAIATVPWQTRLAGALWGWLAFIFWVAGLLTWRKKPGLHAARLFTVASLSTAILMASIMGAQYDLRAMLFLRTIAYIFWPALFLHFVLTFPRTFLPSRSSFIIYLPAVILTLVYMAVGRQEAVFNGWFRHTVFLYLVVTLGAGIIAWAYIYVTSRYERHQLQMRLSLGAAGVGLLPFLSLSLLPQVLYQGPLVPPNLAVMGVVVIPVAFALTIVRERLPILTREPLSARARAEAAAALATLAGDLETLSSHFTLGVARQLGVSDACLLVVGEAGFGVAAATGVWTDNPLKQIQLALWASKVTPDQVFPNLAPPGSGCQLLVPLESEGEIVGMLCLGEKPSGGRFTLWDVELLAQARKIIAAPLHRAILQGKRRPGEGTP